MIDVSSLSAYELSLKLKSGEISSVDLCKSYIERIKKFEKDIQAFQKKYGEFHQDPPLLSHYVFLKP